MSRPYNALRRIVSLLTEVSGTLGIDKGGTGGTTVATAQTALELKKGIEPNNMLPYWAAYKS